jgi:glutaredoxin-related protein
MLLLIITNYDDIMMTKRKRPQQRLVTFSDQSPEFEKVQSEMDNGWFIASLVSNGKSFVGILEKKDHDLSEDSVFIPPRKKIKFNF